LLVKLDWIDLMVNADKLSRSELNNESIKSLHLHPWGDLLEVTSWPLIVDHDIAVLVDLDLAALKELVQLLCGILVDLGVGLCLLDLVDQALDLLSLLILTGVPLSLFQFGVCDLDFSASALTPGFQ